MGFMYAYRNGRLNGNLGPNAMNATYFFDPDTGIFNAITTGVVISSNVIMNESFVDWDGGHGNSSSASQRNQPVTVGYIIRQIPWASVCSPCFGSYECTVGEGCEMCPWRGKIEEVDGLCMCSDNGGNCQACN